MSLKYEPSSEPLHISQVLSDLVKTCLPQLYLEMEGLDAPADEVNHTTVLTFEGS